jgi:hypothetical protein
MDNMELEERSILVLSNNFRHHRNSLKVLHFHYNVVAFYQEVEILYYNIVRYIISFADPDPGSGVFSTPGSGIRDGYNIKIRIRDADPG